MNCNKTFKFDIFPITEIDIQLVLPDTKIHIIHSLWHGLRRPCSNGADVNRFQVTLLDRFLKKNTLNIECQICSVQQLLCLTEHFVPSISACGVNAHRCQELKCQSQSHMWNCFYLLSCEKEKWRYKERHAVRWRLRKIEIEEMLCSC